MTTTIPAGWMPIESAPKDELILVGPTKRMGICVAMNHSRDGWVTETCNEWSNIYTPTHWMPLPTEPGTAPAAPVSTVEPSMPAVAQRIIEYAGKTRDQVRNPCLTAREAIELADWIQAGCCPAPAAGDALALLDHPLLREVLGYVEDAAPADVWGAAQSWMGLRDAAIAQRKGDA